MMSETSTDLESRPTMSPAPDATTVGLGSAGTATSPAERGGRVVLEADGLSRTFGHRRVLTDLSFQLRAGRILGFLGPNGAGKTTAIRIMTTMLPASAGTFAVDGIPGSEATEIRRRIGVLPESNGVPVGITGRELLVHTGRMHGMRRRDATHAANRLLEQVGLARRAQSLVTSYSRGMRQRLGIARALLHDPTVVFLDEPTLGLDPRGQEELLGLVLWCARERGAAVVLCSHLLPEVERVCDDVIILREGEVAAAGPVSEVVGRSDHPVLRVQVRPEHAEEAMQLLIQYPPVAAVNPPRGADGWIEVEFGPQSADVADTDALTTDLIRTLFAADLPLLGFQSGGGRLHDTFLRLTEVEA